MEISKIGQDKGQSAVEKALKKEKDNAKQLKDEARSAPASVFGGGGGSSWLNAIEADEKIKLRKELQER